MIWIYANFDQWDSVGLESSLACEYLSMNLYAKLGPPNLVHCAAVLIVHAVITFFCTWLSVAVLLAFIVLSVSSLYMLNGSCGN